MSIFSILNHPRFFLVYNYFSVFYLAKLIFCGFPQVEGYFARRGAENDSKYRDVAPLIYIQIIQSKLLNFILTNYKDSERTLEQVKRMDDKGLSALCPKPPPQRPLCALGGWGKGKRKRFPLALIYFFNFLLKYRRELLRRRKNYTSQIINNS